MMTMFPDPKHVQNQETSYQERDMCPRYAEKFLSLECVFINIFYMF